MNTFAWARSAGIAVTLLAVACLWTAPANAAASSMGCKNGQKCYVKKAAKKKVAKRTVRQARVVYRKPYDAWKVHGWVVTPTRVAIYHEGVRYDGGNPRGPAMWYNNYEGGFNAALFWKLYERNLP